LALRLVFMGTPDFAVPTLVELVGSGHHVVAVYTRTPQPAGRGLAPKPTRAELTQASLPPSCRSRIDCGPRPGFNQAIAGLTGRGR